MTRVCPTVAVTGTATATNRRVTARMTAFAIGRIVTTDQIAPTTVLDTRAIRKSPG